MSYVRVIYARRLTTSYELPVPVYLARARDVRSAFVPVPVCERSPPIINAARGSRSLCVVRIILGTRTHDLSHSQYASECSRLASGENRRDIYMCVYEYRQKQNIGRFQNAHHTAECGRNMSYIYLLVNILPCVKTTNV